MKYYLAPMEGVTGFIFRNTYKKYFEGFDTYFAPFIVPSQNYKIKRKELLDILPENNEGVNIVPQVLTNDAERFKYISKAFKDIGYNEINLNLGCPSGTVAGKGRGSGFLKNLDELDRFLDDIYKIQNIEISIKTRIGFEKAEEFSKILKLYNKYPLKELIIHPRTRMDFYKGKPNLEVFEEGLKESNTSVCYNGDIFKKEDYESIVKKFEVDKIMIGRGVLKNPGLLSEIKRGESVSKKTLKEFHDEIFNNYSEFFKEEISAMFRMKELWGYMGQNMENGHEKILKIRRAQSVDEFKKITNDIFK